MAGKTNYPVNTEDTIYIQAEGEKSFTKLLEEIREEWPGVELENLTIEHEHRHVTCLTYDLYDSMDYIDYYIIRKNK